MSVFSMWPPEVISGMIYTGPGSAPMLAAGAAWDGLAANLQSTATSYQSAVSGLTSAWQGPSSATMTGAVEPYLSWINSTALQAEQAGAQAKAAGTAFETAFAATVPPPLITANRTLLMALIATNFFGQNAPAIAATEAQYAEMWAQDVAMMNSYTLASTQATTLQSFTAAPPVANVMSSVATTPASGSNILATLPQLVPTALSQLVSPTDLSGGLSGIVGSLEGNLSGLLGTGTGSLSGLTSADLVPLQGAYYGAMLASTPARMFMSMGNSMSSSGASLASSDNLLASIGQFVDGKMQVVVGGVSNQLRTWGAAVSAQLGHAANVAGLSVPQGWSSAATVMSRAAPVLPPTSVSAPSVAPSAGMPGGPFGQALMGALSGRGLTGIAAKAPKIVPRSPAGG